MSLHIADNLELPDEAVTQTFAILAKRGVGKTYTASVMVEEMLENNMHVIVIDPIGVWWGLRTSADGQHEGLPIIIAGGEHADLPLNPDQGELIADLIVNNKLSIVIDLSTFRKGEQTKFMTDFAETLYRRNRNAVHVVLDEADAFAPQRPFGNEARMLGAMEDIVRRGRARGIGVTMITQRPSVLNKNVLTQIEVLVALRLTAPIDQKAIDEWVKTHADEAQRKTFMESLPSLPVGTAWFWSPGWLDLFKKAKVRTRKTLDSSSTPKVGHDIKHDHVMANIDMEALREQLSLTIEKAEADDPKVLRARIVKLEKQLVDIKPEIKEIEVLTEKDLKNLQATLQPLIELLKPIMNLVEFQSKPPIRIATDGYLKPRPPMQMRPFTDPKTQQHPRPEMPLMDYGRNESPKPAGDLTLGKADRLILSCLAQYPDGRTIQQVALITGYSSKGGGFRNALSSLRTRNYVFGSKTLWITGDGLEALGSYDRLPTGKSLAHYWIDQLPLAPGKILGVLTETNSPEPLSVAAVANATGYAANGGGFRNALSRLRTLGLIEGSKELIASKELFD